MTLFVMWTAMMAAMMLPGAVAALLSDSMTRRARW